MPKEKTDKQRIRELENALAGVLQLAAKHLPYARETVGWSDFKKIYDNGFAALYGVTPGDNLMLNTVVAGQTSVGKRLNTTKLPSSWLDP